ncbi:PDZ domain-containing protein, partial [Mycobacterium tuberculosis]|nr:PDZ domain-containing protein [Mycobacterium tuberculosis]
PASKAGILANDIIKQIDGQDVKGLSLTQAVEKIRTDYVDKPDEQKLIEAAINGMVSSLDPHSSYLDAKSFREMDTDMRGQFGGLGIEVTMEDGVLKVAKPIKDTPASKAGILANDIIKQIDGQDVKGLSLTQAVEK